MKKVSKIIVSGVFIVLLASAMMFNAAEIGIVVNNEPVVLEALGSDGDSGESSYVAPAPAPKPSKKANTVSVKAKTAKVEYKKLVKKNQTIALKDALTVRKAKGGVRFTKLSGNKNISIKKKGGTITVKKGLKAGTYKIKVKVKAYGNSKYKSATRTAVVTIKVITAENPIVASGESIELSGDALAKGDQTIARKKAIEVKNAKGAVTYKKTGGPKKILVDAKTGKITVKKGVAPGKYKIKVAVMAAGNKNYKKGTETAIVEITVSKLTEAKTEETNTEAAPAQENPDGDAAAEEAAAQ